METRTLLALGMTLSLAACGQSSDGSTSGAATAAAPTTPAAPLRERSVDEVERLLATSAIAVFDANGERTRHEMGVVPGARLLSSSARYDITTELPPAKNTALVFY